MMNYLGYLAFGIVAGIFGGAFGIGSGSIMIPVFVLIFGMTQHQAQGTALAVMLPPVFILAVWRYYAEGHINVPLAIYMAIGFTIGGLIGAHAIQGVPDVMLKRAFGVYLLIIAIRYLFVK